MMEPIGAITITCVCGVVVPLIDSAQGQCRTCFNGAGATLVAAKAEGRRAIGVEVDVQWAEVAAERLRQGRLDL